MLIFNSSHIDQGRTEDVKGTLDEVVWAMEEAADIPAKRLEESMLLLRAWRNPSLTPLLSPRVPTCVSQHCKKESIVRATSAFCFWRRQWTLALTCTITSLVILWRSTTGRTSTKGMALSNGKKLTGVVTESLPHNPCAGRVHATASSSGLC